MNKILMQAPKGCDGFCYEGIPIAVVDGVAEMPHHAAAEVARSHGFTDIQDAPADAGDDAAKLAAEQEDAAKAKQAEEDAAAEAKRQADEKQAEEDAAAEAAAQAKREAVAAKQKQGQ